MSLQTLLKKTGAIITGAASGITILRMDALTRRYEESQNKVRLEELHQLREQNSQLLKKVESLQSKEEYINSSEKALNNMNERINSNVAATPGLDSINKLSNLDNKTATEQSEIVENAFRNIKEDTEILKKFVDTIFNDKSNNKLIDQLSDIIAAYREFLSHLTNAELDSLVHILLSIFILFCLFSIISRLRRETN